MSFIEILSNLIADSGLMALSPEQGIMILVSFALMYMAIAKKYEPMLLLPIAFGMLLANLPITGILAAPPAYDFTKGGLVWYLSQGVKTGIYPSLIFLGIGAMTDFGPLIANPASLLLGGAAHLAGTTYLLVQ